MRPHVMTPAAGLQPDFVCHLYAYRDWNNAGRWRLLWARQGADSFVHAEGECSAIYHRTLKDARRFGERKYGETATRWVFGSEFK